MIQYVGSLPFFLELWLHISDWYAKFSAQLVTIIAKNLIYASQPLFFFCSHILRGVI